MSISLIVVDENALDSLPGEARDCCILCGSLGVVHFQDKNAGTEYEHRCLKCDATWTGCSVSSSTSPEERLSTASRVEKVTR